MQMYPVSSSNINAIGWDNETLRVQFKNGTEYDYTGVPESIFEELKTAQSAGKFFIQNVKNNYSFAKVQS